MVKLIKLYGERNSSTNYLGRLLELNLEVEGLPGVAPPWVNCAQWLVPGREWVRDLYFRLTYPENLGWKHSCVKRPEEWPGGAAAGRVEAFITITKNPYAWLLSLHRRPYHQYYRGKPDFEEFLRLPWRTVGRDNLEAREVNPVELWNMKNRSYLLLPDERSLHLTAEGLLLDPGEVIGEISRRFAIERRSAAFVNHDPSTKERGRDTASYRDYYLTEKWRGDLTDEAVRIIDETVDRDLMAYCGYPVLS